MEDYYTYFNAQLTERITFAILLNYLCQLPIEDSIYYFPGAKMNHLKFKSKLALQKILPIYILIMGALLRLVYLGTVPGGLHQDEAFVALNAFDLFHELRDSAGFRLPVYMSSWGDGQSAMYTWLLTPLLIFTKGHITSLVCRIPQAVVGIMTLVAVYLLMKRMFNQTLGTISLFLLAICPWHIMMCRWALDANMAPGFLMFSLYFFIRGLDEQKYLLAAGLFYGLSLYCYAVIWPIVPILLILQMIYGLYHKKLRINRWSILASCILFLLAMPLILFVLVNNDILPEITLPFMTIPKTIAYRGTELASNFSALGQNLRMVLLLLWRQNTSTPYDFLLPWGLFYDIGRIFIVIGFLFLMKELIKKFFHKEFSYEYFIFVSLVGGGITSLLVTAKLHQVNNLFIPLVLCEGYGVYSVLKLISKWKKSAATVAASCVIAVYLVCLVLFQRDYYTDYKQLVDAYFGKGVKDCVEYALQQCEETGVSTISAEKATQWPRLLLYTETLPSEYLSSVEYDIAPPTPARFTKNGILINTRINYETINTDSIYIIYFPEKELFEENFDLTPFCDWYVAVPKSQ